MKDQVLSIEQCKELLALGVDMSSASMYWLVDHNFNDKWVLPIDTDTVMKTPEDTPNEERILTFTLYDMLKLLPPTTGNTELIINLDWQVIKYRHDFGGDIIKFEWEDNIIDAVFNMIKWCKEQNLI